MSWERGRNNTLLIFGNYHEKYLLLVYASTSAQRNATYFLSQHDAGDASNQLPPWAAGRLRGWGLVDASAAGPERAAARPSRPHSLFRDSLSRGSNLTASCGEAREGGGPQRASSAELWSRARSLSRAVAPARIWRKLMGREGRRERLRAEFHQGLMPQLKLSEP